MKIAQVHSLAGMFDLDSNHFSSLVEIKNDIFRDFLRIGATRVAKLNIKSVCVGKVFESHWLLLWLESSIGKGVMQSLAIT